MTINIISKDTRTVTCTKCSSILEYSRQNIIRVSLHGGSYKFLICPCCSKKIFLDQRVFS